MKAKILTALSINLVMLMLLGGCSPDHRVGHEISFSAPSPFQILINESGVDLKSEIFSQLDRAYSSLEMTNTGDMNGEQTHIDERDLVYLYNEVASLSEFYLVDVEIDGFKLSEVQIDRYGFTYIFRCVENPREDRVSIDIQRFGGSLASDETWQIVSEQAINDVRGHIIVDGMIYQESINSIKARIGNTYFIVRVPDRLNNSEFLRDLALEVIATSELVFLQLDNTRGELADIPDETDIETDESEVAKDDSSETEYDVAEDDSSETVYDDTEN